MTIPEHIWLPIAVVVSVIAALAFWWWWPRWQVNRLALEIRDPKVRADVEDRFRKKLYCPTRRINPIISDQVQRGTKRPLGKSRITNMRLM